MAKGRPKKIQQQEMIETAFQPIQAETKSIEKVNSIIDDKIIEAEQLKQEIESAKEALKADKITMFDAIYQKYLEKVNEESDINELLPKIFEIASDCTHCTEFGVRRPTSTYALLAAKPKRVVSYDISRWDDVDEVEQLCKEANQDFQFIKGNVLEIDIEQTDMLLIDSYHSFNQATAELKRHANKVNKYILFHDTAEYAYRWKSEPWYPGVADFMNGPEGLYPAIENFLRNNPNWTLFYETEINNGLTVLKKN